MAYQLGRRTSIYWKWLMLNIAIALPFCTVAITGHKSHWADKPVVIDGNNEEWPQPYPFRDDIVTLAQYAIANDDSMLYLTLKTSDAATKMKLRKNGLTVFVDTNGKKQLHTSFGFSVMESKELKEEKDKAKAALPKLNITGVEVKGTPSGDGIYKLENNKLYILAAAATNDYNELVWEIAIPLACLYPEPEYSVSRRKKINICFTFFGLDNEQINQLNAAQRQEAANAMPVMPTTDSSSKGGGGQPVMGENGMTGVTLGGGKKKGPDAPGGEPEVIDAVAAMQDRQRAGADNLYWKQVKLSFRLHTDGK